MVTSIAHAFERHDLALVLQACPQSLRPPSSGKGLEVC